MNVLQKCRIAGWLTCLSLGATSGCSSVMTHTGPNQGYYPGTRASSEMMMDSNNNWVIRPMAAIDLPFSAVLDTLLLPWDYYRADDTDSSQARIHRSEQQNQTAASLPPDAPVTAVSP